MKLKKSLLGVVLAVLVLPAAGQAAERIKADVQCTPTEMRLVYDCMITLTGKKSGQPIEGAKLTVGADMPAMAMAHNVKPVEAMAMGKPGMYHAKLQLEMYGDWALKIDVSGPTRDRLIHRMRFGAAESDKAGMGREPGAMKHDHSQHQHGAHHARGAEGAGQAACDTATHISDAAERQPGGSLYQGPAASNHSHQGQSKPEMEGAHMVHKPQHGGAFFMAPNKLHHLEGTYSARCGLRLFLYNAFTKRIHVHRFRGFIRAIPRKNDEPEVLRFLSPNEDGTVLHASIGDEISEPLDVELYVEFPGSDEPQLFNMRFPGQGR